MCTRRSHAHRVIMHFFVLAQGVPTRGSVVIDVKNLVSGDGTVRNSVTCTITDMHDLKAVYSQDEALAAAAAAEASVEAARLEAARAKAAVSKLAQAKRPINADLRIWEVERLLARQTIDGVDRHVHLPRSRKRVLCARHLAHSLMPYPTTSTRSTMGSAATCRVKCKRCVALAVFRTLHTK
jgi:hypothetical protein